MLPTFPPQSASLTDRLSWYIARATARNEPPRVSAIAQRSPGITHKRYS